MTSFALKAYHDPMLMLSIMTEQELNQIFGTLDSLIPLHEGPLEPQMMNLNISFEITGPRLISTSVVLLRDADRPSSLLPLRLFCTFALRSVESPPRCQETRWFHRPRRAHPD